MNIRCVIVDDELEACKALKNLLIKYVTGIYVVGVANNIDEAEEEIQKSQPDLVFLDIEMPNGNGFALLERLKIVNFEVIFATAYDQYAIKAIKYSGLDYLLKPFDLREIKQSVERVRQKINSKTNSKRMEVLLENLRGNGANERIALACHDGFVYVNVNNVVKISAEGSYSEIFLFDRTIHLVSKSLIELEELLPKDRFFRIHRSFIVNTHFIKQYVKKSGQQVVLEDGSILDVSHRRKDEFLKFMRSG